jgi:RNA polymerase sigma-70 factor (ECF subfamily)
MGARGGGREPDPAAEGEFNRVYEAHHRAAHAYLLGRVGDPDLALELLQETFLRVWRGLRTLREVAPDRRRHWIFAVARNVATDHFRRRATRAAAHDAYARQAAAGVGGGAGADDPETRLEREEELALLDGAIRRLPEDLRAVLVLHVVGELSSAQIGAALERPPGTVRYQLALARRHLAAALGLLEQHRDKSPHGQRERPDR